MDPLSLTASVVAVATVAAQTCSAFARLRSLCKTLPGRLHALHNEVTDIEVVCYQVAAVIDQHLPPSTRSGTVDTNTHIRQLLRQANTKLTELKKIVNKITATSEQSRVPLFAVHAWKREQGRL